MATVKDQSSHEIVVSRHLPTLATRAAVQLDNILINRAVDTDALKQLLELLGGRDSVASGSPLHGCDAPNVAVVVRRAAVPIEIAGTGDALEYVRAQLRLLIDNRADMSRETVAGLRDLCLAVSRNAAMYSMDDDEDAVL